MSKRPKRPTDINLLARQIVEEATGQKLPSSAQPLPKKNAAAVELGSLGGKARAVRLSATQRSEIASKAAHRRWHEKDKA
jgi:hypothetical protein